MNPDPHLSARLDAALADDDPAPLARWLRAAPRGVSTYLAVAQPWGEEQWLALHHAAGRGRDAAVGALLAAGAAPDARTRFATPLHARQTALHLAAAAGHQAVVARLLHARAEVEVRDARGRGPLWDAARGRHGRVVAALLEAGAQPDARDAGGRTPLHAALMPALPAAPGAAVPPADSALARLLDAGADPNATCPREPEAYTPLRRAAALGPAAAGLIHALRAAGADPAWGPPDPNATPD